MGNGSGGELVRILLAEDDDDDYFLTQQALEENRLRNFASSRTEEDAVRSYELGVNSFITKPETFQGLVDFHEGAGAVLVRGGGGAEVGGCDGQQASIPGGG